MKTTLTSQQKADADYVGSLMTDDEVYTLDLSDDRQFRHAVAIHTLAGQTPERNPGLHAALQRSRALYANGIPPKSNGTADDDDYQQGGVITAISKVEASNAAGSDAFVSLLGGAPTLNATLLVIDPGGHVLASGSQDNYNDGTYLAVSTDPASAQPAASTMTSYLQYTYQLQVGGPVISEQVKRTAQVGVLADPQVTQPVQTQPHLSNPYIRIGLGRANGPNSDVDYWFWQGTDNTQYAVPFVGTVQFTDPIVTPLTPNTNFWVFGKLIRGPGSGGGYVNLPAAALTNIYNNCQIINPTTLQWSLPAGTSQSNQGNPIIFGSVNWSTTAVTYLYMQFNVSLQGQAFPAVAVVQSSDNPDIDPLDGVKNIKPIQFLYTCLAAGTLITLADGSKAKVEDLTLEHTVRTNDSGGTLRVTTTTVARHRGKAVHIVTDGGHDLILSHSHVLPTSDGPRTAHELKVGDILNVEGGKATITQKVDEAFEGLLCNVSLSEPNVRIGAEENTLFANGIQVCDYEVQISHERVHRTNKDVVLAAIDPIFHPDYLNYLEEQAAAKAATGPASA
jgi:hypothetical protein